MRKFLTILAITTTSMTAQADPPTDFMADKHSSLSSLLKQPASPTRDSNVSSIIEDTIDFSALIPATFGHPCPPSSPSCKDLWTEMSDQQKKEAYSLLHDLVSKSYKKNLTKLLDYSIDWKESKQLQLSTRVRSEARNPLHPRDPATRIDYIVSPSPSGLHVIDVITEGSSLTKNYYDQFLKLWNQDGFDLIAKRLKSKS